MLLQFLLCVARTANRTYVSSKTFVIPLESVCPIGIIPLQSVCLTRVVPLETGRISCMNPSRTGRITTSIPFQTGRISGAIKSRTNSISGAIYARGLEQHVQNIALAFEDRLNKMRSNSPRRVLGLAVSFEI